MNTENKICYSEYRRGALEAVLPYLTEPDAYPHPRLSLEECAALMFTEDTVPSRTVMSKIERSALIKMKLNLERIGIKSVDDLLAV